MKELLKTIIDYRNERGWKEHDTPESLAKSIIIEAAELLENYQWPDQIPDEENVKEEMADVLIYTLAMIHDLGYDPVALVHEKLEKNNVKYPKPLK